MESMYKMILGFYKPWNILTKQVSLLEEWVLCVLSDSSVPCSMVHKHKTSCLHLLCVYRDLM